MNEIDKTNAGTEISLASSLWHKASLRSDNGCYSCGVTCQYGSSKPCINDENDFIKQWFLLLNLPRDWNDEIVACRMWEALEKSKNKMSIQWNPPSLAVFFNDSIPFPCSILPLQYPLLMHFDKGMETARLAWTTACSCCCRCCCDRFLLISDLRLLTSVVIWQLTLMITFPIPSSVNVNNEQSSPRSHLKV